MDRELSRSMADEGTMERNFIILAWNRGRGWRIGRGSGRCRDVPEKSVPSAVVRSTFDSRGSSAEDSFNFLRFERNYPTCNAALRPQIAE